MLVVPILADEQLTAVIGLLGARGFDIAHIGTHLPSLDEVFLAITGEKSSEQADGRHHDADDAQLKGAAA